MGRLIQLRSYEEGGCVSLSGSECQSCSVVAVAEVGMSFSPGRLDSMVASHGQLLRGCPQCHNTSMVSSSFATSQEFVQNLNDMHHDAVSAYSVS